MLVISDNGSQFKSTTLNANKQENLLFSNFHLNLKEIEPETSKIPIIYSVILYQKHVSNCFDCSVGKLKSDKK